jgi:hypothetical protein
MRKGAKIAPPEGKQPHGGRPAGSPAGDGLFHVIDKRHPRRLSQRVEINPAGPLRERPPGLEGAADDVPTLRRYNHTILRMALAHAVELQLISRNPCDVFRRRLPKSERQEMVTLTAERS